MKSPLRFYKKGYREPLTDKAKYPCLVLVTNNWNDYGYETLFKLFYYPSADDIRQEIGDVKILDLRLELKKYNVTEIKDSFNKLLDSQGSLGQSLDYYTNLKSTFPETFETVLDALNDVAVNQGLRDEFEKHDAFKASLLRFSEAEKALSEARRVLYEGEKEIQNKFIFSYSVQLPNANDKHSVSFDFRERFGSSFRNFVLIGQNGTGKTQYLSNLAASLCGNQTTGSFSPTRPLFSRVIAISFSLFDSFLIPKTSKQFSYKYIGFRHDGDILKDDALSEKLKKSFSIIRKENLEMVWLTFANEIVDLENFGIDTAFGILEKDFDMLMTKRKDLLSSGQNILIFTITELIANLRRDSIVLFDEPETHLHPNAIAKFIKTLNGILRHFNSYAIIATHSPIVLQETPSSNVRIFDRVGNTPVVKELPEESFGENISRITDFIFYRNQIKESYKEFFDEKIKKHSIDEINQNFGNRLSVNALLYLNAINRKKMQ